MVTGADGVFEFAGIADGTYYVLPDCPTHLFGCVRADDDSGPCLPITLFKDQRKTDVNFKMTPGAIIRGRVVDSNGKPVPKTGVRIGGPFLANQVLAVRAGVTKDDGSFEIDRLPSGEWALEIDVPPTPGALRSPLVYYPGVLTRDEAGRIEVATGKVKEGIVITVPPVLDRTLTVRIPPPDETMKDVNVTIVRPEPLMSRRLEIDAEGQATIKGLIATRYIVMATAQSGAVRWADHQIVDFQDESVDVALQLRPTGAIRGRIISEGGGVPPMDSATIGAVWVDNDVQLNPLTPDEGAVSVDGTFEIRGLFGRRMLQLVRFDPDWRIHAVLQGKSDVTAIGIDVAPSATSEVTIVVRPR